MSCYFVGEEQMNRSDEILFGGREKYHRKYILVDQSRKCDIDIALLGLVVITDEGKVDC